MVAQDAIPDAILGLLRGERTVPQGRLNISRDAVVGGFGLVVSLLLSGPAFAATYTVPSLTGASIQATLNSAAAAGSGNTVLLPAGLYNVASAISVPCSSGLTITGPVATPATAVLNATFAGNDIFVMSGCSGVTVAYLQFRNTGGIYVSDSSYAGIQILHNQFTSLPSSLGGTSNASAAVYFAGDLNSTAQNLVVEYNTFGDASSCTAVFTTNTDEGGYCVGVYEGAGTFNNVTIEYNSFIHIEEGVHLHQICNGCARGTNVSVANNVLIEYNYFTDWVRIPIEIQTGVTTASLQVSHNSIVYPHHVSYGTFGISMACCTGGRTASTSTAFSPADLINDNVIVTTLNLNGGGSSFPPFGIEWWGYGAQAIGNNIGGGWGNSISYGYGGGSWTIQGNYLCAPIPAGQYITNEEHITAGYPTGYNGAGNTLSTTCTQQASVAPAIAPASGAYTSPPTVTLSDAGVNTSIYYTTDGSTPVPGSGSTQLYSAPFAITLPATIKSVGMWGVAPQPLSYIAPYGYMPSAVQSASYTATGGVTLASVALNDTGAVHALVAGAAVQMSATCSYSDGSASDCTHSDSHGNGVSLWSSSNSAVVGISSSGLATAVAVGSANVTATVAGMTTPAWAMAVSAPAVSLSAVALSTTGGVAALAVSAVNQLLATCTYSDHSTTNCATTDVNGNVVAPWNSSAPSIATVSGAGVVTGLGAGSTNLTATVTPASTTTQWGQTAENTAGYTSAGYINETYTVLGTQVGGYSGGTCSFYLPAGTLHVGSHFDCGLIAAPSMTTEGSAWQCYYTYTVSSATAPGGFVSGPLSGCGNLAAGSAWWVAVATDSPGSPAVGFATCGSCYPYRAVAVAYGTRSGLPAAVSATGTALQASQFVTLGQPSVVSNTVALTVTATSPPLVSAYLVSAGNVNTITVGGTLSFSARCVYGDSSTTDCTLADIHGNAVTGWMSSDTTVATVASGLATAVAAGPVNITAVIGALTSSAFALTVSAPAVSLSGLSLATTGGVTGLFVGSTNALVATCIYSDGSTTQCSTTDSHGNVAGAYVSSAPSHATVDATTGLVTGVAPGTTTLQASAGGLSSIPIPLTVLAVPSGTYHITITGPVSFSGLVQF